MHEHFDEHKKRPLRRLVTASLIAGIVGGTVPLVASADSNASTAALAGSCMADASTSTGTFAGSTTASIGERVRFTSGVHFDEGVVNQSVFLRPDGSQYVGTYVRLTTLGSPTLVFDASSISFAANGVTQTLVPGVLPLPGQWVIDTTSLPGGNEYRVYFPGDGAALLAAQEVHGVPSTTIPAGGADYTLGIDATVIDASGLTAGNVIDGAECFASASTGPSSRDTAVRRASIAILEPTLAVDKVAQNGTVAAAGGTTNFELHITSPTNDPDTLVPNATAHVVTAVDTLPAGMDPVDAFGALLADGASTSSGGVWNLAARTLTWTIPTIAASSEQTLAYSVRIAESTELGASLENNASVSWQSYTGSIPEVRIYGPEVDAVTVNVGSPPATITKASFRDSDPDPDVTTLVPFDVFPVGQDIVFEVTATFPANANYYDAFVFDTIPDGMNFVGYDSATCACAETPTALPALNTSGTDRAGWYLGDLPSDPAERTFTFRYRAAVAAVNSADDAPTLGHVFTNTADVRFNLSNRLGTVNPGSVGYTAAPPTTDLRTQATDTITYGAPSIAVSKSVAETSPVNPQPGQALTYSIVVTNTSATDAYNLVLQDDMTGVEGFMLDADATTAGVNFNQTTSANAEFTYAGPLAPGASITIVYRGQPQGYLLPNSADPAKNKVRTSHFEDVFGTSYIGPSSSVTTLLGFPQLNIDKSVVSIDGVAVAPGSVASSTGSLVTYRINVTNTGTATGFVSQVIDKPQGAVVLDTGSFNPSDFAGFQAGTGGDMYFGRNDGNQAIEPGGSWNFEYTVNTGTTDVGTWSNTATVNWYDGLNRSSINGTPYSDADSASVNVVAPSLRVRKTPDPGALQYIVQGEGSTFTISVQNLSTNVSANNVLVSDALPAELTFAAPLVASDYTFSTPGPVGTVTETGASTATAPQFVISSLAPGQEAIITLRVIHDGSASPADGLVMNTVAVSAQGVAELEDTAGRYWVANTPQLSIRKTPDAATRQKIDQSGTGSYNIEVGNTSNIVPANNVVITDTLPDTLSFLAPLTAADWTITGSGPVGTITEAPSSTPTTPVFVISRLEANQIAMINVRVQQNGLLPASGELALVNGADATADHTTKHWTDTGTLVLNPSIVPPSVTKTVNVPAGHVGTALTYTLTTTFEPGRPIAFDAIVVDSLPDGVDFVSYGAVTCVSGPCGALEFFAPTGLTPSALADGSNRLGWFFGDVPANLAAPAVFEMVVNARIEETFDGTGTPAAGEPVTLGTPDASPLINVVQSHVNVSNVLGGEPAASPTSTASWNLHSDPASAEVVLDDPQLTLAKTANKEQVGPGETVTYTLHLANSGAANAYRMTVEDDTANGDLSNVAIVSAPAGTSLIHAWSAAQPYLQWFVPGPLAPGASADIVYTGTVPASADLVPFGSGHHGDHALVENEAVVSSYYGNAMSTSGEIQYQSNTVAADVWVMTPIPYTSISGCTPTTAGESVQYEVSVGNGDRNLVPAVWTPPIPAGVAGTARNTRLEVTLPARIQIVSGTIQASGPAVGQAAGAWVGFRNPDVVSGNTLIWNLGDVPPSLVDDWIRLRIPARTTSSGSTGTATAYVHAVDEAGSASRGTASGQEWQYNDTKTADLCTSGPGASNLITLNKLPDSGNFYRGDAFDWTIRVYFGSGTPVVNPVLVDSMPSAANYVPNTATFSPSVTLAETVTPTAAGVDIEWQLTGSFTGYVDITVPSTISGTAPLNENVTNIVSMTAESGITEALTDTGRVYVLGDNDLGINKSVDHTIDEHGTTFNYTLEVTIPANRGATDLVVDDAASLSAGFAGYPTFDGFGTATVTCTAGCTGPGDDPSGTAVNLPANSSGTRFGWLLGDIVAVPYARTIEITYSMSSAPLSDPSLAPYVGSSSTYEQLVGSLHNVASLVESDDRTTGMNNVTIDPATFATWTGASGLGNARMTKVAQDDETVRLVIPNLTFSKNCVALLTAPDDEPPSFPTPIAPRDSLPGESNVRCYITIENVGEWPANDISVRDVPSAPATTTVQSSSVTPSVPLSDGLGYQQWDLTGPLNPGESTSLTLDMRFIGGLNENTVVSNGWTGGAGETPIGINQSAGGSPNVLINVVEGKLTVRKMTASAESEWRDQMEAYQASYASFGIDACNEPSYAMICADVVNGPNPNATSVPTQQSTSEPAIPFNSETTFVLAIGTSEPTTLQSFQVTDQLPYGMEFVSGSAELVTTTGTGSGMVETRTTLPTVPTAAPGPVATCMTTPTSAQLLTWDFAAGAAAPFNMPWSAQYRVRTEFDQDVDAYAFTTGTSRHQRIEYKVRYTSAALFCKTQPALTATLDGSGYDYILNSASVTGVKAGGTAVAPATDDFTVRGEAASMYLSKGDTTALDALAETGCEFGPVASNNPDKTVFSNWQGCGDVLNAQPQLSSDVMIALSSATGTMHQFIDVAGHALTAAGSISVVDSIPAGFSYVPGSAHLVAVTGPYTNPTVTDLPFEPAQSIVDPDDCAAGTGTDTLTWTFQQGSGGAAGAPWNGVSTWSGIGAGWAAQYGSITSYRIAYDVIPDELATGTCTFSMGAPNWLATGTNSVVANVTAPDGTPVQGDKYASAYMYVLGSERSVEKLPDDGVMADGAEAAFTMQVSNSAPSDFKMFAAAYGGDDIWAMQDVHITDTFTHNGVMADALGTATAVDQNGDPVVLTELSRTTVGNTTTIEWSIDQIDGSPSSTADWDAGNGIPTVVTITVPVSVPLDEIDGTRLNNHIDVSTRGGSTYEDDALITVRNPQPAPVPTKTAVTDATINDRITYTVSTTIPANRVYLDLNYLDVLPDGMNLEGYRSLTCSMPSGDPCPEWTVTELTPVTRPDGTTLIGWWFGDLTGATEDRTYTFTYRARVSSTYRDGSSVVGGTVLTNNVVGNANDVNKLEGPIPFGTFDYPGTPVPHDLAVHEPHVVVQKTFSPTGPFSGNDVISYSVTVTNDGDGTAYGIVVDDTPPVELTNIVVSSPSGYEVDGWTPTDPHMQWVIPSLAPNTTATLTYDATVSLGAELQGLSFIDNRAEASAYRGRDTVAAGNRSYAGAVVSGRAPLVSPKVEITKWASSDCMTDTASTSVAAPVEFCIQAVNSGTVVAKSVTVRDLLPAGWTYVAGSASTLASPEPTVLTGATGGDFLVWSLGDMAVNTPITLRYRAVADDTSLLAVQNTALIEALTSSGTRAPAGSTNYYDQDTASVTLSEHDLEISVTPDFQFLDYVPTGGPVNWLVTLTNPDNDPLTNVIVTNYLPAGMTYVPGTATHDYPSAGFTETVGVPGAGPGGTTVITWTFPTLAPGQQVKVQLPASVPAGLTVQTGYLDDAQAVADQITTPVVDQAKVVAYRRGSIGDYVWHDLDADGIQEAGEPPIAGVTLILRDGNGTEIRRTTTDEFGKYLFDALLPGNYMVEVVPPSGYVVSPANQGSDGAKDSDFPSTTLKTVTIALDANEDDFTYDAGLYRPASLGDYVWEDWNSNGQQDSGEPPVGGITVILRNGAGTELARTTTAADGSYRFDGLLPGDYQVEFVVPSDGELTSSDSGSDDTLDSDANLATGRTAVVHLTSGEHNPTLDAGIIFHADLQLTKTANVTSASAGSEVKWTMEVRNVGTHTTDAEYTVTDTLPSNLQYVSAAGAGWRCVADGQKVSCSSSTPLAGGATAVPVVLTTVVVGTLAGSELINDARLTSLASEAVLGNNVSRATVTLVDGDAVNASTTTSAPNGALPKTGSSMTRLAVLLGAAAMLCGFGLVGGTRRRRSARSAR